MNIRSDIGEVPAVNRTQEIITITSMNSSRALVGSF